jgi:hypothetical protein
MKTLNRKGLGLGLAIAMTLSATAAQAGVTDSAIERLCYVKAEDAPVAYNAEAKRYGVSRHELKKLEQMPVCNGVKLGAVKNNWVKRNPS